MLEKQNRIVVTGGAGFIGKHFVRRMLEEGHDVINIDKLTYASDKKSYASFYDRANYGFIHGDITTLETLPECDIVVNFAAESHVDHSIRSSRHFTMTNALGVQNLLDLVRAYPKDLQPLFVQISTDEVYGDNVEGLHDEAAPLHPSNPYAASKAGADQILHAYARTYGLSHLIVRLNNNYGLRQYPEKLIPRSVNRLITGRNAELHGDGSYFRNWLHVEDAVTAIRLIIAKSQSNEVYNVSGDTELSNQDVVRRITEIMGLDFDEHCEFVANRPGQDVRYGVSDAKIRKMGWHPEIDFNDGLAEVIEDTIRDPHW